MIPRLLPLVVLGSMFLASAAWAAGGHITMSSTGYPDSVTIDVTVQDPGGEPTCQGLGVTRNGQLIAAFARSPGATITRHIQDTGLQPNTIYCYRMTMLLLPVPVPIPCGDLCNVFDCFYDIQTCANTGPGPAFMGHGFLSTQGADGNETKALLYDCAGTAILRGFLTVSGTASQYVDSGIAVDVYGEPYCCWAQGAWLDTATAATPHSCVVATRPTTWGAVKSLYRN